MNLLSLDRREGFVNQREIEDKLTYARIKGSTKYQGEVPNDRFQMRQSSL